MKTVILILLTTLFWSNFTVSQNWEEVNLPDDTPPLDAVFFLNENKGWIVGGSMSSEIYITNNGGTDWQLLQTINGFSMGHKIYFLDENTGWLAKSSNLYKTTDGGQNWTLEIEGVGGDFSSLYFTGNGKGIAVGAHGDMSDADTVFLTNDNGGTWEEISTGFCGTCNVFFGTSAFFLNDLTGWIVALGGEVFKTTDGGYTWDFYEISGQPSIQAVHFIDENIGWAAGYDVIFKTTDGGINWTQVFDATQYFNGAMLYLNDIHFTNQNYGWAFGSGPGFDAYVLRTTDGGQNWHIEQTISNASALYDAFFLGTESAWVVGGSTSSGRMYKYNGNLSIDEADFSNTINIYPNPAQDQITINNTSNNPINQVEIYNLLGAKITTMTVESQNASIDVSKLNTGTYFLKIYADGGGVITKKIIKR